jgi:hypothetical protein
MHAAPISEHSLPRQAVRLTQACSLRCFSVDAKPQPGRALRMDLTTSALVAPKCLISSSTMHTCGHDTAYGCLGKPVAAVLPNDRATADHAAQAATRRAGEARPWATERNVTVGKGDCGAGARPHRDVAQHAEGADSGHRAALLEAVRQRRPQLACGAGGGRVTRQGGPLGPCRAVFSRELAGPGRADPCVGYREPSHLRSAWPGLPQSPCHLACRWLGWPRPGCTSVGALL